MAFAHTGGPSSVVAIHLTIEADALGQYTEAQPSNFGKPLRRLIHT